MASNGFFSPQKLTKTLTANKVIYICSGVKFQNTVVIDMYIYIIIIVYEAYPFINHVYWTGPAFSG